MKTTSARMHLIIISLISHAMPAPIEADPAFSEDGALNLITVPII